MIKFKVSRTNWLNGDLINKEEFDKETDHFLVKNGLRTAKNGSYEQYFDSFEDARAHIIKRERSKIEELENGIARHSKILKLAETITE